MGVGNNYSTVRQIVKRRSWWHKSKLEKFIHHNSIEGEQDEGVHFVWTQWKQSEMVNQLKSLKSKQGATGAPKLMYNRLEDNYHLANKKALFMNMSNYYKRLGLCPFEVAIPLTFHIKSQNDPEY